MCTRLSLFGSTYITLMAQNSKTIRIIFLPKCTQKNCAFYAAFYMFFLRISVLSSKTKSALAAVFCGYFYINRPWWVFPLFNSAKIRTKGGHRSSGRIVVEIWNPPAFIYHNYCIYFLYNNFLLIICTLLFLTGIVLLLIIRCLIIIFF